MTATVTTLLGNSTLSFSGHETFVLRGNWLKKAYDLLCIDDKLFYQNDAFVRLGVGKNMANSIRYWGRVCAIFDRADGRNAHTISWLGHAIFAHDGWDPFLVTPTARWLLHYQIASRPYAAMTWYFTFNMLRRGEFTTAQIAQQITDLLAKHNYQKLPSITTLQRDVDCMLRCYLATDTSRPVTEDALLCPLIELDLIQKLPDRAIYRLVSGVRPDLPDELVAYAALHQAALLGRRTIAYRELIYGDRSPGRIFRLDEDALLSRLSQIEAVTDGAAYFTDQAGVRQLAWRNTEWPDLERDLLERAFAQERRYV